MSYSQFYSFLYFCWLVQENPAIGNVGNLVAIGFRITVIASSYQILQGIKFCGFSNLYFILSISLQRDFTTTTTYSENIVLVISLLDIVVHYIHDAQLKCAYVLNATHTNNILQQSDYIFRLVYR